MCQLSVECEMFLESGQKTGQFVIVQQNKGQNHPTVVKTIPNGMVIVLENKTWGIQLQFSEGKHFSPIGDYITSHREYELLGVFDTKNDSHMQTVVKLQNQH